jgi:Ca-activated chloride channel family protein
MRSAFFLCLLGLCCAQTLIRTDVRLVNVSFSVRDARGDLVTNLAQDDVEIAEDGVPQKIAFFAHATDVPLNLALIADFSGSQAHFIKSHHADVEKFLKAVMARQDRGFMVGFGKYPRLLTDLTASARDMTSALQQFADPRSRREYPLLGRDEIRDPLGGTSLYDAVYFPIVQVLAPVEKGRRAAVIFSDGEDNSSATSEFEVIEAAQNSNTVLYCVRYTQTRDGRLTARNKYGTSVMRRMASDTGGEEFDAAEGSLREHFQRIAEQLHSSYELAYHSSNPANDGSFRKIVIRLKQPGLVVRAKAGYYAR